MQLRNSLALLFHYNNNATKLQNIDTQFMTESEHDFTLSAQSMATEVASITTREIQVIESGNNDLYMRVDVPEAYRIDTKPYIERPFYVGEVNFSDSSPRYSLLTSGIQFMPGDIARSNTSVLNMFKLAAYGRPNLILNISMAGTITHAGCLVVGVLPPMPLYPVTGVPQQNLLNTILSGPHGFLNANEATSIALPVPWFCNTDMATLDMETTKGYTTTLDITGINGNYATLVFMVLNPLRPSEGSTTSLNVVIEACFKNFDLVVPTPRFITWEAQTGQARAMSNVSYEGDIEHEVLYERAPPVDYSIMLKHLTYIVSRVLNFGVRLLAGKITLPESFQPQMGLLDSGKNLVTGLFDKTASGLKNIAADAIDVGRGMVKEWTGLHNPNVPLIDQRVIHTAINYANVVDTQQYFEKLDPSATFDRIVKEPIFGTATDEMAMSHITAKDQYLGTFTVSTNDGVGALKWIKPISPFQGGMANADGQVKCSNNLELLHSMHRAWRGGLKLKIQSVMNNKQQVKLKVIKCYNPSVNARLQVPTYRSIANAPSHLLEYTAGGQMHQVDLPYLCRNELCPTGDFMEFEPLFHGLYYVYVAQPLVVSDGSPTTIEFNVYMAGASDLTFYGYAKSNTYHSDFSLFPSSLKKEGEDDTLVASVVDNVVSMPSHKADHFIEISDSERYVPAFKDTDKQWKAFLTLKKPDDPVAAWDFNFKRMAALATKFHLSIKDLTKPHNIKYKEPFVTHFRHPNLHGPPRSEQWEAQSGTVEVMNEPQKQNIDLHRDSKIPNIGHYTRLLPNLDVRPLIRRMYKTTTLGYNLNPDAMATVSTPLSAYLGENPAFWSYTPIETLSRMYYGKTVGFKIRLSVSLVRTSTDSIADVEAISVRVYYSPQTLGFSDADKTITAQGLNLPSYVSPFLTSSIGEVPMTYQLTPRYTTKTSAIYEFVIPDTSFYKFMGSPDKFRNFDGNYNGRVLSTADFGNYVVQFANTDREHGTEFTVETFIGLTDESRMGFHCIAPVFTINKGAAYYTGDQTSSLSPIPSSLNPNLYKGGYI